MGQQHKIKNYPGKLIEISKIFILSCSDVMIVYGPGSKLKF